MHDLDEVIEAGRMLTRAGLTSEEIELVKTYCRESHPPGTTFASAFQACAEAITQHPERKPQLLEQARKPKEVREAELNLLARVLPKMRESAFHYPNPKAFEDLKGYVHAQLREFFPNVGDERLTEVIGLHLRDLGKQAGGWGVECTFIVSALMNNPGPPRAQN